MNFHHPTFRNVFLFVPFIILGIAAAAGMALLFGFIVMVLWNWLMPALFKVPEISYWQSWGIVLLAHILFKGNNHSHRHYDHQNSHWEWKQKFRKHFRDKDWDANADHTETETP
ncbi:MAG: hypothetical protein JXB03_00260 [Spirochaetales bacterium]|nr:hypothetical protein [Spirochaetales bacterium]